MQPYQNSSLPVAQRVADLLARMTLDEKVAQMALVTARGFPADSGADEALARLWPHAPGVIDLCRTISLAENTELIRAAQSYLRHKTRLGIPALVCCEAIHGVAHLNATIYPQAIALGATWNPALVHQMAGQIAREAAAAGVTQVLSPVLDLGRDPRYGRIEECFGECPTLVSRMGVAYISGMQGDNAQTGLPSDKVYCTAKHFAAYSIPANGINIAPVLIGQRELRARHLVPFEAAVREAHVMAVMPSYNSVDGIPSHANTWLLSDVLRGEWGFAGFVHSDWCGVEMNRDHRVAADSAEAGCLALTAGVDLEAPDPLGFQHLPRMVAEGKIDPALIDRAVARLLRAKFLAGLFDQRGDGDLTTLKTSVHIPEHVGLSRRLADESVILLKNEADLLPLDPTVIRSLAVIGPNADQVEFGDYCWTKHNRYGTNVLQGLRQAAGERIELRYAKGCDVTGLSRDGFEAAVQAARDSDAALVVLGDTSGVAAGVGWESQGTPVATVGESYDVSNPVPPGVQEELARAVIATGKPVIIMLLSGRPYCIPWLKEHAAAIIQAFFPGEQQGVALADILLGKVNPSGRLPVTIARSAGHIPCTYDFMPYGRGYYHRPGEPGRPGKDYVFDTPEPLWPFGFGLSYTTFAYAELDIATDPVPLADGVLRLAFTVTNTGKRSGKVTSQVYWRDLVAATAPPEKRLLRFEKIELAPGASRRIRCEVPVDEFQSLAVDARRIVEPGEIEIQVGDNAEAIALTGRFRIA